MKRITHKIRWWIALIADLIVFFPSAIKSGFWQRLSSISAWNFLFTVSALGLIAFAVAEVWERISSRLAHIQSIADEASVANSDHISPVDPTPLIQAEATARAGDIASVYKTLWENVAKINGSLDYLAHKPEPTLKQRTTQLANELFALLQKLGPQPPDPLSLPASERNTEAKQLQAQNAYFDWQRNAYYNYRAHFRNRVIQIDDELAASKIFIKLDDQEIDPPKNNGEIKLKKIAETLLLTAQTMPHNMP